MRRRGRYTRFRCGICDAVGAVGDAQTFNCTGCDRTIRLMCRACYRRMMYQQRTRCDACHVAVGQSPLMRYTI